MTRLFWGLFLLGVAGCSAEPNAEVASPASPETSGPRAASGAAGIASVPAPPPAKGPLRFNRRTGLALNAVAWSPDGKRLATWCGPSCEGTSDAARTRVLVWSLPDLTIRSELEPNAEDMGEGRVYAVAWSADGSRIAVTTHNEVTLWRAEDATLVTRVGVPAVYGGIEFSPDSRHLATTGVYGHVIVLDSASGKELLSDALHNGAASYSAGIEWSGDATRLYAEGNSTFGVWDTKSGGKKLKRLTTMGGEEGWMQLSADEKLLLLGAPRACFARVYRVATLSLVKKLEGKDGACNVALSPRGDRLAYLSTDGSVRVAPLDGKGAPATITKPLDEGADRTPGALAFSPDGRRLLWGVGPEGGVWDLEKNASLTAPAPPLGNAAWKSASVVEVSRDGHNELFDVDKSVIVGTSEITFLPTAFEGLTALADGDLSLKRADGGELVVRAVHDGKWRVALLDPKGRAAGSESLLASDAYDAARGAGAPFDVAKDLAPMFFAGLSLARPSR